MVFAKEPEDQLVGDLSVPIQEDSLDFVSSPLLILSLDRCVSAEDLGARDQDLKPWACCLYSCLYSKVPLKVEEENTCEVVAHVLSDTVS